MCVNLYYIGYHLEDTVSREESRSAIFLNKIDIIFKMSISSYLSTYSSYAKAKLLVALDEANELLQFTRLKSREQEKVWCSGVTPPDSLLRKVFQLEEEKLSEEDLYRLRKKFQKNCRSLLNAYYDRKYYNRLKKLASDAFSDRHFFKLRWDGADTAFKMNAEIFVNLAIKAHELGGLSWSDWLTTTSEGQMLLEMIRSGSAEQRIYASATLFTYLLTIYITSGYDDYLFQKEFLEVYPVIKENLPESALSRKVLSIASGKAILAAVRAGLQYYFKTPDAFFENWLRE